MISEPWVIEEFRRIGLDTAKSVLEYSAEELEKRVDLERETIEEVYKFSKKNLITNKLNHFSQNHNKIINKTSLKILWLRTKD